MRLMACGILAAGVVVLAQAPNVWTLKIGDDKASGQKILTATTEARVSGPASPMYRLTLACVGRSLTTAIATFDASGAERQLLDWQTQIEPDNLLYGMGNRVTSWREIHYQIDDHVAQATRFEQTELSNEGSADLLHKQSVLPEIFIGLPRRRLLVSGVVAGESVEFPFDALTPEARATIQRLCFPAQRPAGSR
jgi:hypothetical protein